MVFEGIDKVKNDIKEDEIPKPVLSYPHQKHLNEKQLLESSKKFD